MNQNIYEESISIFNSSAVSDVVVVDCNDDGTSIIAIPENFYANAGMLITGTVPINDIEINFVHPEKGNVCSRFVVNPSFAETYNNANGKGASAGFIALIAVFQARRKERTLVPILVTPEGELAFCKGEDFCYIVDEEGKFLARHHSVNSDEAFSGAVCAMLDWWCFIQTCLTNPPIRERFAALSRTKTIPKGDTKKKRGTVRYVKTHYLDPEEWGIIKKSESGRTYTCLAWYVIGHWREYKNGHRVFIKPYWKGTMRNSIEEAGDVTRNRIVAQMETVVV